MPSIFQLLLEREAKRQSLEDAIKEVSRYATKNFKWSWLKFVREYPHPNEVLRVLARDENGWVRMAVAVRKQLPEDLLRLLAQDENGWVRLYVAEREQDLPEDVLKTLAQDEDWRVREAVKRQLQRGNRAS